MPYENRTGHTCARVCRGRQRHGDASQGGGTGSAIATGEIVLPVQTLNELFHVPVRKAKRRPSRARAAALSWRDAYAVVETSAAVLVNATDLASDQGLSIWDSVVLAASAEAECRLLLSVDLQEGFTWRGVTVTDPFAPTLHPILAAMFRARSRP